MVRFPVPRYVFDLVQPLFVLVVLYVYGELRLAQDSGWRWLLPAGYGASVLWFLHSFWRWLLVPLWRDSLAPLLHTMRCGRAPPVRWIVHCHTCGQHTQPAVVSTKGEPVGIVQPCQVCGAPAEVHQAAYAE